MNKKMEFCLRETYWNMIRASVGSKMFQTSIFKVSNGEIKDLCQNGRFSCSFFTSCILRIFSLSRHIHLTVNGLIKDMVDSKWFETDLLKSGAVLIWEPKLGLDGEMHRHIGFYLGYNYAVSNDPRWPEEGGTMMPIIHHFTFNDTREIEKIYWHSKLNK
jgi:hypothetical protein